MNSLVSEIDLINDKLIEGIQDSFKCYGLCKTTSREKETQIFEVKSKDQVIIDDIFKSFFYHKLDKIDLVKDARNPGKKNMYQANASINLVSFSVLRDFDEHVLSRLSKIKLLTVNSVDYDSQKIISQETAKKDFDFHKYLFVVNYQILYKTENCYDACL